MTCRELLLVGLTLFMFSFAPLPFWAADWKYITNLRKMSHQNKELFLSNLVYSWMVRILSAKAAKTERDKAIALLFVDKYKEARGARRKIAKATGVSWSSVDRAIEEWLEWAKAEAAKKNEGSQQEPTP
jgi:hypothetical protein